MATPVGKSSSGKTGWDDYGTIVKQVAAQRVARLGPHAVLGLTPPGNPSSLDAANAEADKAYYDRSAADSAPDTSGGGLNIGTPFSSAWHGLVTGIERAGSILPDIYHEQDIAHQKRVQKKDFGIGGLLSDYYNSIKKGGGEALSGNRNSDFAKVIQEHSDVARANADAKAQGEAVPNFQDIKSGSAYVNPYLKGWAGFAGDITTNPINLIGAGTIPAAEKAVEGLSAGEKALQGLKTAKIAAAPAKKQIALKLAGHAIPTGVPAVQLGARMAASESPKVQKVLEAFRPLANHINNPEFRNAAQSAKGSADAVQYQYMHKILSPMFRNYTKEQQQSILKQALTVGAKSTDKDVLAAHSAIQDLAKMMHEHNVPEDLYNYHVPKHLQLKSFDPKKGISVATELMRVAGNHEGGISSFLGNVHHGIQKAIEHKKIFDELPSQPKIRPKTKGHTAEQATSAQIKYNADMAKNGFVEHSSPALAGRLVHESIVPQINRAENLIRARGQYMGSKWYTRALDKSNSFVKKVDVGANPASTARRTLSFVNQQILNGHFDPQMLQKAIAVNLKHHGLYRNLDTGAIEGTGIGKIVKVGKERIPSAEVFAEGSKRGLFANFTRSEVRNINDIAGKGVARKAGHKVLEKMFNANEHVDNSFRMATFLHAIKTAPKGLTKDKIYDYAMNEVRKTHLDFSGLTPFERKYLTRMMPFYAAISRSTPIAFRQLLAAPGRASVLPLAQRDFGQSFDGQQGSGAIPEYLLRDAANPAGMFKGQPVMLDQKNDITDAYQQFLGSNNPLKLIPGMISQTTPVLKDPVELAGGHSFFTGAPTRDSLSSLLNYFASQTPETNLVNKEIKQNTPMKERGGKEAPMPTGKTSYFVDPTVLKALTGFGTTVVTPRQQASAQKQQAKKKKHPWYDWFQN